MHDNPYAAVFYVADIGDYLALMGYGAVMVYAPNGGVTAELMNNGYVKFDSYGFVGNFLSVSGSDVARAWTGEGDDVGVFQNNWYADFNGGGGNDTAIMSDNVHASAMLTHGDGYAGLYGNATALLAYGDGDITVSAEGNGAFSMSSVGGGGSAIVSAWNNGYSVIRTGYADDHVTLGGTDQQIGDVSTGGGDDQVEICGEIRSYLFLGDGNDVGRGGSGQDYIEGGNGRDLLSGGRGDDVLLGGNGNDALFGDEGRDALFGDKGADLLVMGVGDIAAGGAGADSFAFDPRLGTTGIVQILDFNAREGDVLDLSKAGIAWSDLFQGPDGSVYAHNAQTGLDMAFQGMIDLANVQTAQVNADWGKG